MANDELKKNLGYHLDLSSAEQFRTAIQFCGLERFRLCLKLVSLWMRPETPPKMKHERLLALMRLTAPIRNPNAKYRRPETAKAVEVQDKLDNEALDAAARDDKCQHGKRETACSICSLQSVGVLG